MPLTDVEKWDIKFHLGYPGQGALRSMVAGFPTLIEASWQLDAVLSGPIDELSIPKIQQCLAQLEEILWVDLPEARLEHKVDQIEEIKINLQHERMLMSGQYRYYQQLLGQILCVPINPNMTLPTDVYGGGSGGGVTNFTVSS